ncbi:MAG: hypothetical protein ACR2FH_04355 [Caulobacteraceae bacterium]
MMAAPVAGQPAGPAVLAAARSLDADLLAHDSATATLARRCAARRLADPSCLRAIRIAGVKPADREVRALLAARPGERVRYRHVRLACGSHVFSDADNWYLPARLGPAMNRALETSDAPFGAVVAPLAFHRRRLEAKVLIDPSGRGPPPPYILRHRAVLITGAGVPFSVVVERYTREAAGGAEAGTAPVTPAPHP